MPELHSIIDRLYYANRRSYTEKNGNVAYLDGSVLRRPLSMPRTQKITLLVIVIIAIIIGILFLNATLLSSMRESAATEQAIEENLQREASIQSIPQMAELATLSDKEIREKFEKDGFTIYDATEDEDEMVLYKLPSDINANEATGMFALGISALSAPEATRLLNGSWYFGTERTGATSMVTRYADFETGDPQEAVQRAVEKQGIDPTTIENSGVDDSGNTFSLGSIEIDKKPYTWKISALPLDEMYSINGMPEEACYVGIRITASQ